MKHSQTIFAVFISLILSLITLKFPLDGESVTVTTELTDLKELRNRIILKADERCFIWTDVRGREQNQGSCFGLSTPRLILGPVSPAGLFREIQNPLGFSPGSSVFKEKTGMRLDTAFFVNKKGIYIEPLPDRLALFGFMSREILKSGLLISVPEYHFSHLKVRNEFLVSTSLPLRVYPGDRWYLSEPCFPGGRLFHGSARVILGLPFMSIVLSSCLSGGERVIAGTIFNTAVRLESAALESNLYLGLASKSYYTPDGEMPDSSLAAGMRLHIIPWDCIGLGAGYFYRAAPATGRPGLYREGREVFAVEARGKWELGQATYLTLSGDFKVERLFEAGGAVCVKKEISISTVFDCRKVTLKISSKLKRKEDIWERGFEFGLRYGSRGSVSVDISCLKDLDLSFGIILNPDWSSFRLEMDRLTSQPEITLGWEVKT
jgi:hypothetical protein